MSNKYKKLTVLPALSVMIGIFWFSSQTAVESSGLSGGITESIFDLVIRVSNMQMEVPDKMMLLDILETIIRKVAHMTEYAILAGTVSLPIYVYGMRKGRLILWSEVVCVLYAMTDEIHQLYVAGRSGQIGDVFIDGIGALLGCMIFAFFVGRRKFVESNLKEIN